MGELVGMYALVTSAAALLLATASILYARIRQHQMVVRRTLERCYVSILNRRLLEGGDDRCVFPLIERRSSRLLLATVVARIGTMTYGYDRRVMAEVVSRYELDRLLLNESVRSRGMRRAQWLHTLAQIECRDHIYERMVARYGHHRNPYISLCLTLASLNNAPERCIAILADCERPLSPFELSEVLMMLKRGLIPVAYQPLLRAEQTNVRLLGLCIVRYFGVTEAEEEIVAAIATDSYEVVEAALFTLCSLHLCLDRGPVREAARAMSEGRRRSWYRHLASEGYSARAIAQILPEGDRQQMREYVEQAVASYKRCLMT